MSKSEFFQKKERLRNVEPFDLFLVKHVAYMQEFIDFYVNSIINYEKNK